MNIIRLDKFEDERVDVFARLTEPQLRNKLEPERGIFVAESPRVIERALDAGYLARAFLVDERLLDLRIDLLGRIAEETPVYVLSSEEIRKLTGCSLVRGVVAALHRKPLPSVEEVVAGARRVAVFDQIVNHTNVGALFRSAAALGVDAVLVTPTCCDPLYRRCSRVSMGAVFKLPWTRIGSCLEDWPEKGLASLHELGFKIAAFALRDDSLDLCDERLKSCEKLALVFGTEGDGLADTTIDGSDFVVKIPMTHEIDSLNVAAAGAVAFWELCGKHSSKKRFSERRLSSTTPSVDCEQ